MKSPSTWLVQFCTLIGVLGWLVGLPPAANSAGSLVGALVDEDGKPIVGARMLFEASEQRSSLPLLFAPPTHVSRANVKATTDKEGYFRAEFKRSALVLLALENSPHWIEPNQGFQRGWFHNFNTDVPTGEIMAYHWPSADQLADIKETAPATQPLADAQELHYSWTTGVLGPPTNTGPSLAIALKVYQEPGSPERARLSIRAVSAGLWAGGNDLPYAPSSHYERGLVLYASPALASPGVYNFYVQSTEPVRYARVRVKYDWRQRILTCTSRSNPTGSRLLSSPAQITDPPPGSLSVVENVRAEWWTGLEMSYGRRPTNSFVIFDPSRAEAALRRLKIDPLARVALPYPTEQALLHLAGNPTSPTAVLETIAHDHWNRVTRWLISNPATSVSLLEAFVSTNRDIRATIATRNLQLSPAQREFLKGN